MAILVDENTKVICQGITAPQRALRVTRRAFVFAALLFGATQTHADGLDLAKLATDSAGYCVEFLEGGSPQDSIVAMGLPVLKERKRRWVYRVKSDSPNQRFDLSLAHARNNRANASCSFTGMFTNETVAGNFVRGTLDAFENQGYAVGIKTGLMANAGDKVLTKGDIVITTIATFNPQGGVISTRFIRKQ